jgi:hypothetical protein
MDLPHLQRKPHFGYTRGFLITASAWCKNTQSPYNSFCRESHTASTNIISLLPFIQREPHYKHQRYFLTTVSAGRTTLQGHMWFSYYSFCRDTASTHVISLPLFLLGEPHCKHTCGFCIIVVAAAKDL